ncbi:MAG: O-antigen ligase family protein [Burkholderiaceae bacterium]
MHAPVNAQVDAVFVLSVRSFHARIAHIDRELKRHGIAFEWIFDYDADTLTSELIEETFAPSDLGRPQQSLVLKHIETWRRCVDRGYRRVLVLEDDAMLASNFAQMFGDAMHAADALAKPYMVYLGCGDNKYVPHEQGAESPLVRTDVPLPATDAIVVDNRAARLRLEYVARHKIKRPADWLMRQADAAMGIDQYWLKEPIVEQGSMNGRFASVLDRKRIGRGRAWSWLRFRWDRWRRRILNRPLQAEPIEAIQVPPDQLTREKWAIGTARAAAALVAIGSFTSPAVISIASATMLLAFCVAPSCLQRVRRAWNQPLGKSAIVFVAVLLLSTTWSTVPFNTAFRAWIGWHSFLLLFIALAIFDTRASKLALAVVFVTAASLGTLASFFAFDLGTAQPIADVKAGIVLRNHVTQALALTMGAALALVLLAHSRRRSWMQWTWGIAAASMVINVIFVTYARSGYVALAIVAVASALGLWRGRTRGAALAMLLLLAVIAVQFSPLLKQRFATAVEEVTQTDSAAQITPMGIRVMMWDTAAAIVREAPLFGHGLGSFPEAYRRVVGQRYSGWKATLTDDPHNQYLLILAEAGLLGMAAFAWFLYSATKQSMRGPFRVIGLALLVAWCVNSLFSSHFHAFNEVHLIAIVLAACLAREVGSADQATSMASTAALTSS